MNVKYIQIEHSGSGQTSYRVTSMRDVKTLAEIKAEGGVITERADLKECVNFPARRVIQVRLSGVYAGTTGKFFAEMAV